VTLYSLDIEITNLKPKYICTNDIVAYTPVNNETTAVAMQRSGKHASTIELLLETVFSTRPVQRGCKEENLGYPVRLSQSVKRRLGGWCEMAAILGVSCQLRVEFCTGGCEGRT
jgi:hypothetical protein